MATLRRRYALALLSVSTGVAARVIALQAERASLADDPATQKSSLQEYMHRKMDASSEILEGIVMENGSLIRQGGVALLEMSKAEKFQVLTDREYRLHNRQFRESVDRLLAAAEKEGYDRAALAWFDVTISCVDCHDHVRKTSPAAAKGATDDKKPMEKK